MNLRAFLARGMAAAPRLRTFLQSMRGLARRAPLWVPPGHYYSPIPSLDEIERRTVSPWASVPPALAGIELNDAEQCRVMDALAPLARECPAWDAADGKTRYSWPNDFFPLADAVVTSSMLRHLAPSNIVEIGAGYSTAVMLDTNERFFERPPGYTVIEPYPQRLFALLKESDLAAITVMRQPVQDVDAAVFAQLQAGDLLFIDSSHVSKTASDVNFLFFEILPRLASGVYVQIHDVAYPFEYPKVWTHQGRAWNEAYVLRSFLQFNSTFKIAFWGSYLLQLYHDRYMESLPACRGESGGSIWLYRI